ncbi:MAG: methionyl-tRNA formyltransferase, partial [Pseudomonadota bacterium]
MTRYVYATNRVWSLDAFSRHRNTLPGEWAVVTSPYDLAAVVGAMAPRYIFFPHWSHIVPKAILDATECVCFHMTDVPYGRGGSPLQNLIVRGHEDTVLTALRMTKVLDGGPVYGKIPLSLEGSAADIFARMAEKAMGLI